MKLSEAIFLSLSVAFFIIGVHQTFVLGMVESYWLFMLSVTMLLLFKINKGKHEAKPEQTSAKKPLKQPQKNKTTKVNPRK
jgi:hypothetical protein